MINYFRIIWHSRNFAKLKSNSEWSFNQIRVICLSVILYIYSYVHLSFCQFVYLPICTYFYLVYVVYVVYLIYVVYLLFSLSFRFVFPDHPVYLICVLYHVYNIATLGPTWEFQPCLKCCNLASWTTKWHESAMGTSHPPTQPPTQPPTTWPPP